MEKISVIIPIQDNSDFLPFSLQSIYNGTYRNIEVIVVERKASEEVHAALQMFDPPAKYILKPEGNYASIKNAGLDVSTGRYITFMDPNDVNGKMRLELEIKKMEDMPDIKMVYCATTFIDENNSFLSGVSKLPKFDNDKFFGMMLLNNRIVTLSTVLFNKSVFDELGSFDESLPLMEEYDFYLRAATSLKSHYIDLPLLRKRVINDVKESNPEKEYKVERRILKKMSLNELTSGLVRLFKNEKEFRSALGFILLKRGDYKESADNLRRAIALDPANHQLYYNMGDNFYEQGDYTEAKHWYKTCLNIQPDNIGCKTMLEKAGEYVKSQGKYKKVFSYNFQMPQFPLEKRALGI